MMVSYTSIATIAFSLIFSVLLTSGKHHHKDPAWAHCPLPGSQCRNTGFSGSKVHKVKVITPTEPTLAQRSQLKMMAGFGATTQKKKEKVGSGAKAMKKQIANFVELTKSGSKVMEVFVREQGQSSWNLAGEIAAEGDALDVGAFLQKRLICDHAKESFAFLKQTKQPLEVGYGDTADSVTTVPKMDAQFIKCGFRPNDVKSGSFFKATDQYGLKARIDSSSKAGVLKKNEVEDEEEK